MLLVIASASAGPTAGMGACVRGHFAREEGGERIGRVAREVPPSLEGLEEKRMASPVVGCRHGRAASAVETRLELTVVGRRRQERTEDLTTQTCPSHARARRVVVVGHGSPAAAGGPRPKYEGPCADGKNRKPNAIFCASPLVCAGIAALSHRDPSGQLAVVRGASQARSFATAGAGSLRAFRATRRGKRGDLVREPGADDPRMTRSRRSRPPPPPEPSPRRQRRHAGRAHDGRGGDHPRVLRRWRG